MIFEITSNPNHSVILKLVQFKQTSLMVLNNEDASSAGKWVAHPNVQGLRGHPVFSSEIPFLKSSSVRRKGRTLLGELKLSAHSIPSRPVQNQPGPGLLCQALWSNRTQQTFRDTPRF